MCSGLEGLTCSQCMWTKRAAGPYQGKVSANWCLLLTVADLPGPEQTTGTRRGSSKWKDVMGAKVPKTREALGDQEESVGRDSEPLGEQRPTCQAAARPPIVDVVTSADEMDREENNMQGKSSSAGSGSCQLRYAAIGQKHKAEVMVPMMVKCIRVASGPIDLEEELQQVSYLLDKVQNEVVAMAEWARAVDVCLLDVEGWVWELRKRAKVKKNRKT